MPIDIRTIDPDETSAWLASLRTSFNATWPVEPLAEDVRTHWDYGRVWAASEGDDHRGHGPVVGDRGHAARVAPRCPARPSRR